MVEAEAQDGMARTGTGDGACTYLADNEKRFGGTRPAIQKNMGRRLRKKQPRFFLLFRQREAAHRQAASSTEINTATRLLIL